MAGQRGWTCPSPPGSGAALRAGLALSGLTTRQLWIAYFGLGGSKMPGELELALDGRGAVTDHEHDLIAQALNDHFIGTGQNHLVAYASELHARQRVAEPRDGHDATC
jgi:hypothetical protein